MISRDREYKIIERISFICFVIGLILVCTTQFISFIFVSIIMIPIFIKILCKSREWKQPFPTNERNKMGFLDKAFGKSGNPVNEDKRQVIDINESKEKLNNVLVNLSKKSKVDLTKHAARVALAMDYSLSMDNLFSNGSVQKTISRLLPIALKFDDNGELESWLFSNGTERLNAVSEDNYKDYVNKIMKKLI